jgi:hypothetical protein
MIYANVLILLIALAAPPPGAAPRCDGTYAGLFTPVRPELGRYEVCTSDAPLDGDADALEPLDAFGSAGIADRGTLQRLYGGRRVRVQRSWTASTGAFVSITRLSPYPDPTLTRILPGTMEIRFVLSRGL